MSEDFRWGRPAREVVAMQMTLVQGVEGFAGVYLDAHVAHWRSLLALEPSAQSAFHDHLLPRGQAQCGFAHPGRPGGAVERVDQLFAHCALVLATRHRQAKTDDEIPAGQLTLDGKTGDMATKLDDVVVFIHRHDCRARIARTTVMTLALWTTSSTTHPVDYFCRSAARASASVCLFPSTATVRWNHSNASSLRPASSKASAYA